MNAVTERRVLAVLLAVCGFLFPLFALAGEITGGFPSGSIWLSKTSLTDGDGVQVFAPVYDAGTAKMQGNVSFSADGTQIGDVAFQLSPGETKIVSVSWTAKEGTHEIAASIEHASGGSGEPISLARDKTEAIKISVAAAPPPPAIVAAAQSIAAASAPVIAAAGNALYGTAEDLRTQAQTILENALAADQEPASVSGNAPSPSPASGLVLGAETEGVPAAGAAVAAAPASFSVLRILEQAALFIVSYQWAFYPVLLALMLGVLYILAKRIARPRPARP